MANPTSLRKAGLAVTKRSSSNQAVVAQASVAVVTTTPTTSAYGYTLAQATAVLTAVNAHTTEITAALVLLHELRTAMINAGLIKGS